MKSIYITADLEAIRSQVREYVEQELVPNVEQWETERAVPRLAVRRKPSLIVSLQAPATK